MKKNSHKKTAVFLAMVILLLLSGCGSTEKPMDTVSDFNRNGTVIAVADGYIFEEAAKRTFPEAEIRVFSTRDDTYKALLSGAVDGVVDDEPIIRAAMRSVDEFQMAEGLVEASDYGFVFPKNEKGQLLASEMSAYLINQKESGDLAILDEKWFGSDTGNKQSEDASALPSVNGTVTIAFEDKTIPFAYFSAGRPVGYEVDLAIGFCREYGYGLIFQQTNFSDILTGTAAGTYDMGCSAITITDERQKSLLFGGADYSGGIAVCKLKEGLSKSTNTDSDFERHFNNTFIEDQRYLLFLKGIGVTCLIAGISALLGTILGALLFIISRRAVFVVRGITKGFLWVLGGVPAIILIMQLYYAYYRNFLIGGIIASIIGFTLIFGRVVYRMIERRSLEVSKGRLERDYRLEALDTKPFFRILKEKKGEAIRDDYIERVTTLIKVTSVVGYIAVEDLVSVFNAIRMESYETLMPLIFTTIVYFVLIKLVTLVLKLVYNRGKRA